MAVNYFAFGGGGPVGGATINGGVSGDMSSSVQLDDIDFFNDFLQEFDPGNLLQFTLQFSTNVDPIGPDGFTFAITNSIFSFFDVFVHIDLDSPNPSVLKFASDPLSPIGNRISSGISP